MQKHTSNTRLFREPGSQYDMYDSTSLLDAFCDMVLGGADKRLAPMTISEDGATLILELNAVMRWLSVSIIMFAYNLSKSSTKGVLQYRNGWILALVTMTLARTKAITEIAGWNEREERLDMVFFFSAPKQLIAYLSPCRFQASDAQVQPKACACPAIECLFSTAVLYITNISSFQKPNQKMVYLHGMSS